MSLLKVVIRNNKKNIFFCGIKIYSAPMVDNNKVKVVYQDLDNLHQSLNQHLDNLRHIVLPSIQKHPEVFNIYKNIYKNKNIVLVATGPSCMKYVPIENAIHVGVNSAYNLNKVHLDYLFIQDRFPTILSDKKTIDNYSCKKFFGIHYMQPCNEPSSTISHDDLTDDISQYYFENLSLNISEINLMSADITTRPLMTWGSVSFCALEFILWTHPKKIYLVGCDNSILGHFDSETDKFSREIDINSAVQYTHEGWKILKKFDKKHYPDTEIISVNPVGLKGMFKDLYQGKK